MIVGILWSKFQKLRTCSKTSECRNFNRNLENEKNDSKIYKLPAHLYLFQFCRRNLA
ncbi:hypothetical protein LEP1GSC036_4617 [Leptospira weilii str. 2006001853]|uniref:Uncharacterized protein n=1 Tax=Leptospira weilii str. 2006001853 TaxID=1001589 RepID=A0A828Z057_9LEPT|nr:hypothetical protein LEP1GSC036_4617 [Leptospira weilii str. 2006001853]EMJ61420.1 hypothetical protein LEP1GSC051_2427 [Leptospira sp. P2653]EMN44271.1 hypothetical protein LEP1GSC086_2912 [Leptospira weilii str. LNT 1234]